MIEPRIHRRCGQPMTASILDSTTPAFRGQPIWLCPGCSAWEPREGWHGALPAEWDGHAWTASEAR